jgi:hypothetical protein
MLRRSLLSRRLFIGMPTSLSQTSRKHERANLVASLLACAWRAEPEAADCGAEELEMAALPLMETGAAALAWRRLRNSELASTTTAGQLHDVYRLYQLLAIVYEREVANVFRLLRSHSIEAILVKGLAASRHYGEPAARPCGDVDVCVRPEQYEAARVVLKERADAAHYVDLHKGFRHLDERSFDELLARSETIVVEGERVRVLKAEDHLRVLCYHFLREGGWRPVWLCDISAAVEARTANFDWDLCMSGRGAVSDWVTCSVKLAHQLLRADLKETPAAVAQAKLPRWLLPGILREWEVRSMSQRHRAPVTSALYAPLRTLRSLRHHWPSPVEATVSLGGTFSEGPRLPFQVGNALARTASLLVRLRRSLHQARKS